VISERGLYSGALEVAKTVVEGVEEKSLIHQPVQTWSLCWSCVR
jgi:hypothetical protein